jgi:hypothetical protein
MLSKVMRITGVTKEELDAIAVVLGWKKRITEAEYIKGQTEVVFWHDDVKDPIYRKVKGPFAAMNMQQNSIAGAVVYLDAKPVALENKDIAYWINTGERKTPAGRKPKEER